jgi:predicted RNase H-like nuclease (RuvC/YqgF family)
VFVTPCKSSLDGHPVGYFIEGAKYGYSLRSEQDRKEIERLKTKRLNLLDVIRHNRKRTVTAERELAENVEHFEKRDQQQKKEIEELKKEIEPLRKRVG